MPGVAFFSEAICATFLCQPQSTKFDLIRLELISSIVALVVRSEDLLPRPRRSVGSSLGSGRFS